MGLRKTKERIERKTNETQPLRNQYRRSVYSTWKRNAPSPSMLIFGASRKQVCSVKREQTTTPLQPLVMLNNPQLIEGAKSLALQLLKLESDDQRIQDAFIKLLSRKPQPQEVTIVKELLKEQRAYFAGKKAEAAKFSKAGKLKQSVTNPQETAAWTVTINALMNLDSYYLIR